MSPEAWSALIAAIGVAVALFVFAAESRRARFSQALDIVGRFDDQFWSSELRQTRRRAAAYLLDDGPKPSEAGEEAVRAVLNFFETLGFLYRKKAVDAETIWHYFGSWLLPYYVASTKSIQSEQARDPNCYRELKPVYDAVFAVEERERHYVDAMKVTSREQVRIFLEREATLPRKAELPPPAA